ncbi:hypothetical protein [Novosphingobium sp.]|uniref:hypothetical protein n=1 Tax=Novosphingobium sp. TaxID=1874826 RepID=UPI0033414CFB
MAQLGRAKWWLLAVVLLLGWCKLTDRAATYRFRMTVEAETPRGSKRASGVYAVHDEKHWVLTSEEKPGSAWIVGEAIVLRAGDGPIFVLMDAPGAAA